MRLSIFLLSLYIALGIKQAVSSYLDAPRMHFAGQFRADANTRNNKNCNFDLHNKLNLSDESNYAGTGEFEFINAMITSVIDTHGTEITNSELISAEIISNDNAPFAKLVDLDVDFQVTSIFGLKFGLKHNGVVLFEGTWTPCVAVHDLWKKVKCSNQYEDKLYGVQSTTKIVDIVWSDSPLISEFKSECQNSSGELHVSITLDSYNCDVLTIGRIYGTIGIAKSEDPLCVGGERKMEPVNSKDINGQQCMYQNDQKPLMYSAPFKYNPTSETLVVDLSNAFPTHFTSVSYQRITALLDIGELYLGCLIPIGLKFVAALSEIPYLNEDMWKQSGVIEVAANSCDMRKSPLVVFKLNNDPNEWSPTSCAHVYHCLYRYGTLCWVLLKMREEYGHNGYVTCWKQQIYRITLLLQETELFVRPMGYYMARLQHSSPKKSFISDSHKFTLFVTKFGNPISNTPVTVINSYNQFGDMPQLPAGAVKYDQRTKLTNETGHVTFHFTLEKTIPLKRQYHKNPNCTAKSTAQAIGPIEYALWCYSRVGHNGTNDYIYKPHEWESSEGSEENMCYELPVDGQVYNFYYCADNTRCQLPNDNDLFLYKALISILAFSTVKYNDTYEPTWTDDIKSIFEQKHHLFYAMRSILDLSNFTEVTLPHNIELLKYVLSKDTKEDFDKDPNYMPVTRNLSPAKRQIILKWLNQTYPCFNKTCCNIACVVPQLGDIPVFKRCSLKISYASDPQNQDEYFQNILAENDLRSLIHNNGFPPRPLFGLQVMEEREIYPSLYEVFRNESYQPVCNIKNLKKQLQQAVQLEFYTIPLYLTSLYSIINGRNTQAYRTIREVVMQEMLHMVQAVNILIAVGGQIKIDDPKFAPSYPATGLPGHVLRNLSIHLKNYNLIHVHNTFMGIELPQFNRQNSDVKSSLYTIGMFYNEISHCIQNLANHTNMFKKRRVKNQVKWPWNINDLGTVHVINDTDSAIAGIKEIIEQGEGASSVNPQQLHTGKYAHFYQFEELVCQKKLVDFGKNYAFDGAPIIYDGSGVYPMIDDPNKDSFQPNSRCYTQARAFHRMYRKLLQVLQKTFNGQPDKITEAVELMESLQVHAKRCISTKYLTTDYNCGPVWDYEWE